MSTISSFKYIEYKCDVYRGKDCMEEICEFLTERAMKIISFKKEKNDVTNTITARMILKSKRMLYL